MRVVTLRLTAAALGAALGACSEPADPPAGPAAIEMVLGNDQDGNVGQSLGLPFMVRVTDAQGAGVGNVAVPWSVTSGDGALNGMWEDCSPVDDDLGEPLTTDTATTDAEGFAWVSFVPAWFGPTTVVADVKGLEGSPVTFTVDATDTEAAVWAGYPFDQVDVVEVIAGPQRSLDLHLWVTDGRGWDAPGVAVTWEVTSGGGELGSTANCGYQSSRDTLVGRTRQGVLQVSFQAMAFGLTTVTATVPGIQGPPLTFTFDATLFEIRLSHDAQGEPVLLGPDYSADAAVPVGATVEWVNGNDSARITSTSAPAEGASFDSGALSAGDRFRFVPPVAGTWEYVDEVSGATGTLTAEGQ